MLNEKKKLKQIDCRYAEELRLRRGDLIQCTEGRVWITADGSDYIINKGETLGWKARSSNAVIWTLLSNSAEVLIEPAAATSRLSFRFSHKDRFLRSPLSGSPT